MLILPASLKPSLVDTSWVEDTAPKVVLIDPSKPQDVLDAAPDVAMALGRELVDYVSKLKLESNTYQQTLLQHMIAAFERGDAKVTSDDLNRQKKKALELSMRGLQVRNTVNSLPFKNLTEYANQVEEETRRTGFGNCTEQAIVGARQLTRKGYTNFAIIGVDMVKKEHMADYQESAFQSTFRHGIKNHTFLVLGLDVNADLADPSTWGENAVVVDPWIGFAAPVSTKRQKPGTDGLSRIREFFMAEADETMIFNNWVKDLDLPYTDRETAYDWENYRRKKQHKDIASAGPQTGVIAHRLILVG